MKTKFNNREVICNFLTNIMREKKVNAKIQISNKVDHFK